MALVFEILHSFFQMADTSKLQGHSLKLKKVQMRLDLRKFTLTQ